VFEKLGLNVTDGTDDHLKHFKWFQEHYDEQVCTKSPQECAYGADPFYQRYQTLEAVSQYVQKIQSQFPNLITSKTWGRSTQGREQTGVVVTGNKGGAKQVVFYFCGEHAREWLPVMFCVWMAENLATGYGTDQQVTEFMDKFEFHILPVMNPDGYVYAFTTNNMWRKSRKANSGTTCVGTDLNRNYAFRWGTGGSSRDPCSETYMGVAPWDNPEVKNLENYAMNTPNLAVQTDVHAYGRMWMHPWGYSTALCPDDALMTGAGRATVAAIRAVHGQVFAEGSIANVIYIASGSSCDFFYGTGGVVYAYAPEVRGTSFQPPASNIIPSNEELWAGMLAQVEYVATH